MDDVAVQWSTAVAFAVAPAETARISAPLPRSVILSVNTAMLNVSAPAPPVSVSPPLPPVNVSALAEPTSVTAFPLPLLVSVQPEAPVAELTLRLNPRAVIDAVPALLVDAVAVQTPAADALAVAPADTTRMSEPSPRSEIVSVPESTLKVSLPVPPTCVSFPAPPVRISVPRPPTRMSFPICPLRVSFPSPPITISSPSPAFTVSSRSRALINSLTAVPVRISLPLVPTLIVKVPFEKVILSTLVTVSVPSGDPPRKSTMVKPPAKNVNE